MTTLTTMLFVGGESHRMGTDKAMLVLKGEPLWKRQLCKLQALRPANIMISGRNEPSWCPRGFETVLDKPPSYGPLSGLAAGLNKIQTTHLLALAIDLPQMTTRHLKKLWSLAQPGMGVVSRNGRFFEPLCAIYPIESLTAAEELLSDKDFSLQKLVRSLVVRRQVIIYTLTRSEAPIYRNINTTGQLARLSRYQM